MPLPEVYWWVRCGGSIPDYPVTPAVAGQLAPELEAAEKIVAAGGPATWVTFDTVPSGLVKVRSTDVDCLEESTPGVRRFIDEQAEERKERERREGWQP